MKENEKEKEPRIKELEDFANDFFKRLGDDDEEEIDKPLNHSITGESIENQKEKERRRKLNIPDFSLEKLYKKKKQDQIVIN